MNRLAVLVALGFGSIAHAQDADPGIFGTIDVTKAGKPAVINARPVIADSKAAKKAGKPIYLHVPPGHEWHWYAHCGTYSACSVPVYFVKESWFVNVYLPVIGSRDGREQRYRVMMARERASEREIHDQHGDE
jgi:hypothetical protein